MYIKQQLKKMILNSFPSHAIREAMKILEIYKLTKFYIFNSLPSHAKKASNQIYWK